MNYGLVNVTVIYSRKIIIRIMVWSLLFIFLLIISYLYFPGNIFVATFITICLITPWLFLNKIIEKYYSNKVEIKFDFDLWVITITEKEKKNNYKLSDIKSYRINESSTGYSAGLSFKLNSSKSIYINILNKKTGKNKSNPKQALQLFQSIIEDYNCSVGINKQIIYSKTFEESVYGLFSIYVFSVLIIVAICLHIIYHKISTLPLTLLFAGGVLIRLIAKRQSDVERQKKE